MGVSSSLGPTFLFGRPAATSMQAQQLLHKFMAEAALPSPTGDASGETWRHGGGPRSQWRWRRAVSQPAAAFRREDPPSHSPWTSLAGGESTIETRTGRPRTLVPARCQNGPALLGTHGCVSYALRWKPRTESTSGAAACPKKVERVIATTLFVNKRVFGHGTCSAPAQKAVFEEGRI